MRRLENLKIPKFDWANDLERSLLALAMITLLFKESINGIFLALYLIVWTIKSRYRDIDFRRLKGLKVYFLVVLAYLLWILIGNFQSVEPNKAMDFLAKQAAIFVVPIIINHRRIAKEDIAIVNRLFFCAVFIYICYLYLGVLLKFMELGKWYILDPDHPTWKYYLFTSGRLSPDVHPTFLSMFIVYGIFTNWEQIKNIRRIFYKIIALLVVVIFVITLLLLSSRGALISFFIVFGFYQTRLALKGQYNRILYLVLSIIMVMAVFSDSGVLNRISKLRHLRGMSAVEIANIPNSSGKRMQVYLIAEQLVKDNFWMGIGTKNWEILNKEYYHKEFSDDFEYRIESLNTHNQYLNALVSWGIIGISLFLAIMVFQLLFGKADNSFFLFWCFMTILLFTENILNRHRGIIFFSIVSAFTIKHYLDLKANQKMLTETMHN